jgi:phosphatidylserine decarboxylase
VGGTVYHAFLNQWCYHRWHSPVSGTIVKSYKLPGAYFLINPTLEEVPLERQTELYLDSLPMHCSVNVRHVFIIRLDDGSNRHVGLIEVGLVEVSTCTATVVEGQIIKKGEELGYFAFGGSTYALIFDKNFDLTFNPEIF